MKKLYNIFIIVIYVFLIQTCTDDTVQNNKDHIGEIIVKLVTSPDKLPRTQIKVNLSFKSSEASWETPYELIDSMITDPERIAHFTNLKMGYYLIDPLRDDFISGQLYPNDLTTKITVQEPIDTLKTYVSYYWDFNETSFDINADTNKNSQNENFYFYNSGIRDTLICEFDISQNPDWMYFRNSTSVYIPNGYDGFYTPYLEIGYIDDRIPIEKLPLTISIPVHHQFGVTNINIHYKLL